MNTVNEKLDEIDRQAKALDEELLRGLDLIHQKARTESHSLFMAVSAKKLALGLQSSKLNELASLLGGASIHDVPLSASDTFVQVKGPSQPIRKTAVEIILAALAAADRHSQTTGELTDIVMQSGLSKAAAEKAKYLLKSGGFVTVSKKIWSLTDAGLQKVSGVPPGAS